MKNKGTASWRGLAAAGHGASAFAVHMQRFAAIVLQAGATIINSVVRGPTIIGENTRLENAYIGPYTSVYHNCEIINSELEHSIVLEHVRLTNVPLRIVDSMIGRYAEIGHTAHLPRALQTNLGDYSKLWVP